MKNPKDDFFNEFSAMAGQMHKIFNQILKAKTPPRMSCQQIWAPPCDVFETPHEVIINLEVPGIHQKDVHITVRENALRIRGCRREQCTTNKINYYQMEIHYGEFERVVLLPTAVTGDKLKTTYHEGFVQIILPKAEKKKMECSHG